jgi:hypothetical protein
MVESTLYLPPRDVIAIDPDVTYGVAFVGMGRAGKTTGRGMVGRWWREQGFGEPLGYSASDGFRGLTAKVAEWAGLPLGEHIDDDRYKELLEAYITATDSDELMGLLDSLYRDPEGSDVLRSPAVDKAVPLTAEHPIIRPAVNTAAAYFLRKVIDNPGLKGLPEPPSLTTLDARNMGECLEKFNTAGVQSLGTFVLTCPEEIVIDRKKDLSAAERARELALLKRRNALDRGREIPSTRMTLPVDLGLPLDMHTLLAEGVDAMYEAGVKAATIAGAGIVIPTDRVNPEDEASGLDMVMRGMVNGVSLARI